MRGQGGDTARELLPIARRCRLAGALIVASLTGGCFATAPSSDMRGVSVSFESIDGPPTALVQKIAQNLNDEARARQIVVLPAGGSASYRIRGYFAAGRGDTSIAWAWDVYDEAQHRAFRLRGEEAGSAGRRAWAGADDQVLRRIARSSIEQFAAFLSSAREPANLQPETPAGGRSIIAVLDDFGPEAAGIFRLFTDEPSAQVADTGTQTSGVPLPRLRPIPSAASAFAQTSQ